MALYLKDYIESNFFSESSLLTTHPFVKKDWSGYIVSGDGGCITEEDFALLKICINQITQDASIKCCLSIFYSKNDSESEWETTCNWEDFITPIDDASGLTYSGLYFLGSSEKWGGISVDGEIIMIGGEYDFIKKFEEVAGGYEHLKQRFEQECTRKTYAFRKAYFVELRKIFYSR